MKEKGFLLPTSKYKELMMLSMMEDNPDCTQKEMAREIGASASMVNVYLDDYEARGLVQREYITAKKVRYHITPKGLKQRNFLRISYMEQLMDLNRLSRKGLEDFLQMVADKGFRRIFLYGAGEVAGILLGVLGYGMVRDLEVLAVVDDDPSKWGSEILGYPVIPFGEIGKYRHDGIFISSYSFEDEIKGRLLKQGYEEGKIITFFTV